MKKLITLVTILTIGTVLAGCTNKDWVDTTFTYNKAIIKLQNGKIVEGNVKSWRDYKDGDQIQVEVDGTIYLVHSNNVDLINDLT